MFNRNAIYDVYALLGTFFFLHCSSLMQKWPGCTEIQSAVWSTVGVLLLWRSSLKPWTLGVLCEVPF